ncbi:MAG: hypothetical protein V7785_04860 [Bermanella sp.]
MRYISLLFILSFGLNSTSHAEVEELSNTEMTEAYIQDGAIVVKQRIKQRSRKPTPTKVNLTVGPGEPAISQSEQVLEQDRQNITQNLQLDKEISETANQQQLLQFKLNQLTSGITQQEAQSSTAIAQQNHAQDLVRQGLNLTENTQITPDLMAQYLQTFTGTYIAPNGSQQAITNQGYQFSTPNPNSQINNAIYPIGNTMSVEVTDQQVIWNLLFPQKQ